MTFRAIPRIMLNTPLSTFDHKYFFSMIDQNDPQSIPDFFAQNIENWNIRNRGQLEMRDGLTARGSSPTATNLGRGVLKKADGTLHLVRVIDGAGNTAKFQYSTDGSTWADISGGGSKTTGKLWHMTQANDIIYAVNGYDTPVKYDGSSMSTVAAIPNGTAIAWWKNFLWVTGVLTIPDRLYFSNDGVPETWGGTDYLNVNLGDVSHNVGLCPSGGTQSRLFIGKERSVWYLTGDDATTFTLQSLTYEHGVASHESMLAVKNDVWAVDQDGHIRGLYRSTSDDPFATIRSRDITQTVANLNRSSLTKASAVYYDNYAMFFVPNGVDSYNSIVLVFDTLANEGKGGWLKYTGWNIAHAAVFPAATPKLFLFDSRTDNGQTYEWTGTSDNGTVIIAVYETKLYDHGFPERQKVWKFTYSFAPVLGNVDVNFYSAVDRYYYTKLADVNLQGTGNKLLGVNWTLGVDKLGGGGFVKEKIPMTAYGAENTGYCIQVKLEGISISTKLKIRNFTMHYRVKGLH